MTDTHLAKQASEMLQALAEPTRLRIVELLLAGEKNVTEIATELGVEIVNVSHHLKVLRMARIITDEKRGRFVAYTLNTDKVSTARKTTAIEVGWCRILIPHASR